MVPRTCSLSCWEASLKCSAGKRGSSQDLFKKWLRISLSLCRTKHLSMMLIVPCVRDWEEGCRCLLGYNVDCSDQTAYDDEVCGQISTSKKSVQWTGLARTQCALRSSQDLAHSLLILGHELQCSTEAAPVYSCVISCHISALISCACCRGNQKACNCFLCWENLTLTVACKMIW